MPHIAVNTRLFLSGRIEGISRFAYEVLKRMVQNHPEVTFSFFFDRAYSEEFIFGDNVTPYVIHPQSRHPVLWYTWFHAMVPRKLNQIRADLFFSPEFYLSSHKNIPQVPVFHDLAYEHYPDDIGRMASWYCRRYSPIYAEKASHILTVSEFSKEDIHMRYQIPKEKISVVYNGAGELFHPLSAEEQALVREKYTGGKPFFHFVGTLNPRKNIESLLLAFDKFKEEHPNPMQLLLVGRKGWKYDAALHTYEAMKYKSDVCFTGFVEDDELARIYAASWGLCFIPHLEGFGIPLVEAMHAEIPIISSKASSMPEVAGDAALWVDATDIAGISNALERLYGDSALRSQLAEKGKIQRQRFSWDLTYGKVWSVLNNYIK